MRGSAAPVRQQWDVATALVLSAGGMFAAWEVGAWKVLARHFRPDLIVGASAGAWNGWAIAGGATPDELAAQWLEPSIATIRPFHTRALHDKARALASQLRPSLPFGLTTVEVPRFRVCAARGSEVTWRHLAATCSILGGFPPVAIDGKYHVDGGLLGALPLWLAEEMGATRAIALSCLTGLASRALRSVTHPRAPSPALQVTCLQPSRRLGSLRSAVVWSRCNIENWIALGEQDAMGAVSSITM